jgi:PadR family transcriptional regulator
MSMESLDRELRRGTLELLILRALATRPTHGYELVQSLRQRSGGFLDLKEGTLYPVLYRLEDGGFIVPEWEQPGQGGRGVPRKVYRLTPAGGERLAALWSRWAEFVAAVEAVLEGTAEEKEERDEGQ